MDNMEKLALNGPLISSQLFWEVESLSISEEMMRACERMACAVIAKAMLRGEGNEMV